MTAHRLYTALALLLIPFAPAFAEENVTLERVAENVQKLGSTRFNVREQAARDLTAMGEPALKALKAAVASKDEEISRRADLIVRAIESRLLNDALIRATKLRLQYDNKPLDVALADLSQKTGLPFVLDPKCAKNPKEPITLDTGDVVFWEAIEKFLATAGLVEVCTAAPANGQAPNAIPSARAYSRRHQPTHAADNRLRLVESRSPLSAATGSSIRVKVLPNDLPGATITKGSNEIHFMLDVMPAPQLAWLGLVNVDIRKAIDDRDVSLAQSHIRPDSMAAFDADGMMINNGIAVNGRQMIIQGQGNLIVNGNVVINSSNYGDLQAGPASWRHVPVTLLGKDSTSKRLKELEGVVTAQVLAPAQTLLAVNNLLTVPTKDAIVNGEYRLQITERKQEKSGYLHLRFRLEMPASIDGNGNGMMLNGGLGQAQLFQADNPNGNGQPNIAFHDANDKPISNVGLNMMEQSFNGATQSCDYVAVVPLKDDAASAKFVLSGRKAVCVDVPFILKNVPLP